MKYCKYCKSEIDERAKICPYCRKQQGISIVNIIVGVIVGLIIMTFILTRYGHYLVYRNNNYYYEQSYTQKDNFTYEITKKGKDTYGWSYYLEGIVTNNGSKSYSYVQIEFNCYDKNGINLGSAFDNSSNLLAYEKWKFKAVTYNDVNKIDHCNFYKITGW